jgi:peptidoglycan/LPS O-acetylase OafA/YrhL
MSPTSPIPVLLAVFLALSTVFLLKNTLGITVKAGRFASIDGLRGYLAFLVFLHHSSVWYFFIQSGSWARPDSGLYDYFGMGSVKIFFMVTGFLFFGKILDSRNSGVDWLRLYVSRFLRIAPLYLVAVAAVFAIVAYQTWGQLNQTPGALALNALEWLSLGAFEAPELNGVPAGRIVAHVLWTLRYEWFFYLLLPIIALTAGVKSAAKYVLIALLGIVYFYLSGMVVNTLIPFVTGILAAVLTRNARVQRLAGSQLASAAIILTLVVAVLKFPNPMGPAPIILLSIAFVLIAAGNTMYGVFTSKLSCILGEISFSIYLLHGIFLYVMFNLLIGTERAKLLSPVEYWLVIAGITPVLILTCYFTYTRVEHPGLMLTTRWTNFLRSRSR